ncbi:MAG TPA: putative baseplate assembly protein, partial [Thermoanaerobaculia bacterium]|jgi:predicted phage baseplate assembly protein|nr:putative baseplate assembly protein [Thermoanaerobaculia bacterium]
VRDVINPIEASGGADPESRDDARRTIPVSLQALGRVVSVRDYADFARTFAGISKASAAALSDGRGRTVVLTIGGADDIEIPEESDLYRNLDESLRKFGDPYQPFVIRLREKIVLAGAARVRVDPDYLWSDVAPNIRAALLDTFSFDRRDYGQPVYPAEVIAAIQRVPGVASVDLDVLGGIRSTNLVNFDIHTKTPHLPQLASAHTILPRRERFEGKTLHGAEIAYLPPQLADLFILTEIQA